MITIGSKSPRMMRSIGVILDKRTPKNIPDSVRSRRDSFQRLRPSTKMLATKHRTLTRFATVSSATILRFKI